MNNKGCIYTMDKEALFTDELDVIDNGFFDEKKFKEWYDTLLDFAAESIEILKEETGNVVGINFEINTVLLKETVYDAIIGLKTVVASKNNTVKAPNPFKIAAYLGYWFLRHKPIIFRAETNLDINNIQFTNNVDPTDRKEIIVEIKHINEIAAARFLLRYIFELDEKPVCDKVRFDKVKKTGNMNFNSFPELFDAVFYKLKYHLMYREISPKILEHFLEAYTLHPYVKYTCNLWESKEICK